MFQDPNSSLKIIIFTIETGSVGYNFDVANQCIFNDYSWNPSKNEQGTDRIRRITSRLESEVIFNILPSDSQSSKNNIEQKMFNIMTAKRAINEKIHECLREAFLIKQNTAISFSEKEDLLNQKASELSTTIYSSLQQDQEARSMYRSNLNQSSTIANSIIKWWKLSNELV